MTENEENISKIAEIAFNFSRTESHSVFKYFTPFFMPNTSDKIKKVFVDQIKFHLKSYLKNFNQFLKSKQGNRSQFFGKILPTTKKDEKIEEMTIETIQFDFNYHFTRYIIEDIIPLYKK